MGSDKSIQRTVLTLRLISVLKTSNSLVHSRPLKLPTTPNLLDT